ALGIAVRRAWADADCGALHSKLAHAVGAGCARGGNGLQADGERFREMLDQPGAPQQFQIIETLMAWNVARLRPRDGMREQPGASVASVTDALRNAGQPGHQRRIE